MIERRKAVWRDRVRAYRIVIDRRPVGKLMPGERAQFPLSPGQHRVQMKIDWCSSPAIAVDGAENAKRVCDAGGGSFLALFQALFTPGRYIRLERA